LVTIQNPDVIHVDVTGLRNEKGKVMCAPYSSAEGFPKDAQKAIAHAASAISEGKAHCEFSGIEPGTYAVFVFHDENSNGKLDTNFMGIRARALVFRMTQKDVSVLPNSMPPCLPFCGKPSDPQISIDYL
jgi:uncharacterized protein (DUF2141 family)